MGTTHAVALTFLHVTDRVRLHARRVVAWGKPMAERGCERRPNGFGYHNAGWDVDELHAPDVMEYAPMARSDSRWPTQCACGYMFSPDDEFLFYARRLYVDDAEHWTTLDTAPVGSLWLAPWMTFSVRPTPNGLWAGPDGLCVVVRTPGGDWWVDGPGADPQRRGWERTGSPPGITVTPGIQMPRWTGRIEQGKLITLPRVP